MFRAPRALRAPRILRTPEHREYQEHQNAKRRDLVSSKLQNTSFLFCFVRRYLTSGNVIKTTFSLLPLSFHTMKKFRDGQSSLYNTKQSNRSTLPLLWKTQTILRFERVNWYWWRLQRSLERSANSPGKLALWLESLTSYQKYVSSNPPRGHELMWS